MDKELFDGLMQSFNEAIAYSRRNAELKTRTQEIADHVDKEGFFDQMTDDQKVDYVAKKVLIKHKEAFKELAK